jgi:hypothetical protein
MTAKVAGFLVVGFSLGVLLTYGGFWVAGWVGSAFVLGTAVGTAVGLFIGQRIR